jgi:hypothetical protein
LVTIAHRGQRLRLWTIAYPCHDDGLGLRALRDSWTFIPVSTLEASGALALVIESILTKRTEKEGL